MSHPNSFRFLKENWIVDLVRWFFKIPKPPKPDIYHYLYINYHKDGEPIYLPMCNHYPSVGTWRNFLVRDIKLVNCMECQYWYY